MLALEPDDAKELWDLFSDLDTDGVGKLSVKDVQQQLQAGHEGGEALLEVFKTANRDQNKMIDINEFVLGQIDKNLTRNDIYLQKIFDKYDTEGIGALNILELKMMIQDFVEKSGNQHYDLPCMKAMLKVL